MIHFCAVKPETEIMNGYNFICHKWQVTRIMSICGPLKSEQQNYWTPSLSVLLSGLFSIYMKVQRLAPQCPGLDGIPFLTLWTWVFWSCICIKCLVPGLAALWGARVRWGVFIAGSLHAWSFTLELFTRWRQWLIYCTQNVSRLGLEEQEIMGFSVWHVFYQGEMRLSNNITISEVWVSSPFLAWRMTSSLVGDNFLCCWNSKTESNVMLECLCRENNYPNASEMQAEDYEENVSSHEESN